jgi:tetratricopeptide (TPR) repeat protein
MADRSMEAENLIDTGAAYRELGDYAAAEDAFHRSVSLYEAIGEDLGRACALKEFADMLVTAGRPEEARPLLTEAHRIYAGLPDRMGLAAVGNSQGKLEWAVGEVKASAAAHESALSAAREIDNQLEEADAHLGIARALLADGEHAEARDAAERARTIYARIGAAGIDRAEALLARM